MKKRIISEFSFDKKTASLQYPGIKKYPHDKGHIYLYSLVAGHLWIANLVSRKGYADFLLPLFEFASNNNSNMVEWELSDEQANQVSSILSEYNLHFERLIKTGIKMEDYVIEFGGLKDKENTIHTLCRYFHLIKTGYYKHLNLHFSVDNIEQTLQENRGIINSTYLILTTTDYETNMINKMPDSIRRVLWEESLCIVSTERVKYYPNLKNTLSLTGSIADFLCEQWENFAMREQVILSKFAYSLRIISELSLTLIGANGILSCLVTRVLFDNLWQTKFLIQNNEIEQYYDFTLDRLRLHVFKRTDRPEVKNIDILLIAIQSNLLDPIPVHGDYFRQSPREICISLGMKDMYDKYYEYNSEFIHASMTAVFSGAMAKCENPEHNFHLTINPHEAKHIDSMQHILEIINFHIDIVNSFLGYELVQRFEGKDFFFTDKEEYRRHMESIMSDQTMNG